MPPPRRPFYKPKPQGPKANHNINYPEVRVVDEKGQNMGVYPIGEALKLAQEKGLDLVEITPNAKPPIVKIIDLGKFIYQKSKEEKKHKQKTQELKSVQIGLMTGKHDLEIKVKKIVEFLSEGNPVEIRLFLRGREKANKDYALKKLREFLTLIPLAYKVTTEPKFYPKGFSVQIMKA